MSELLIFAILIGLVAAGQYLAYREGWDKGWDAAYTQVQIADRLAEMRPATRDGEPAQPPYERL